jgi:hypothetical protein
MKSATEILNAVLPSDIFTENNIKEEYRVYCKQWHPDLNLNSEESNNIIAKVNALYTEGIHMLETNTWVLKGQIKFTSKFGKIYSLKVRNYHEFELGKIYISTHSITYELDEKYKRLYENGINRIKNLTYSNDKMKNEMEKYLPTILETFESKKGTLVIILSKSLDLFLLKDILEFYNGKLSPKHVAWILSSLYNISCYLDYAKLSHNGISLDTYTVSPKYHSGLLVGGWWYTVPQKEKMISVSEKIYSIMPPKIKNSKFGSIETDLESIRLIGRELLGDRTGTRLIEDRNIPKPLCEWLRGVSYGKARVEYENWQKVLTESFGKREFTSMSFDIEDFYKSIGKLP